MSDPDKREKLENAIFTKGTCTHMCDEKERVDRIFELQLDRAEMVRETNQDLGMRLLKCSSYHIQRPASSYLSKDVWSRDFDALPQE